MRLIGDECVCVCGFTLYVYAKAKTIKCVLYFQVKNWCFVTYRYFNFGRVPTFTKILQTCAWKPVVIEASIGLVYTIVCNVIYTMYQVQRPNYCATIVRIRSRVLLTLLGLFSASLFIVSSI